MILPERGRGHPALITTGYHRTLGRLEPKGPEVTCRGRLSLERQAGVQGLVCLAFRGAGGGSILIDRGER